MTSARAVKFHSPNGGVYVSVMYTEGHNLIDKLLDQRQSTAIPFLKFMSERSQYLPSRTLNVIGDAQLRLVLKCGVILFDRVCGSLEVYGKIRKT